nr:hypothetical protein [Nostoc punctiforme]
MCKPNRLLCSINQAAKYKSATISTGTGTQPINPLPSQTSPDAVDDTATDFSSVMLNASPRAALAVNKVTTNGWSRARDTRRPLTTPSNVVLAMPPTIAAKLPCRASIAATTPPRATREPTDRSIPPLRITTVMPSATIASILFCRMMFIRLRGVRNVS